MCKCVKTFIIFNIEYLYNRYMHANFRRWRSFLLHIIFFYNTEPSYHQYGIPIVSTYNVLLSIKPIFCFKPTHLFQKNCYLVNKELSDASKTSVSR